VYIVLLGLVLVLVVLISITTSKGVAVAGRIRYYRKKGFHSVATSIISDTVSVRVGLVSVPSKESWQACCWVAC
jgi:hypothetical protein